MSFPFAGAALALGLAGSGAQWWLGNKAADAARDAAGEEERRREKERQFVLGEATARGAASGVEFESASLQTYLTEMSNEFRRQHEWAVRQSSEAARLGKTANALGALTGVGSSLLSYGAATGWGRPR